MIKMDVDEMNNKDLNIEEKTSLGDYFFISVVAIFLIYCLFTIQNIFGSL